MKADLNVRSTRFEVRTSALVLRFFRRYPRIPSMHLQPLINFGPACGLDVRRRLASIADSVGLRRRPSGMRRFLCLPQ